MMNNKSDSLELPKGWVWTKLGEISILGAGNPAPQGKEYFENGVYPFVRVQDMGKLGSNVYLHDTRDHINAKAIKKMKLFSENSVLFTKSGMSILLNQRAILARDMYIVSHIGVSMPLGEVPSEWVYYWLKTLDFKNLTHATTLPSLQLSKVHEISIPLPPLPEQHRIVVKIEELFTKLDAGIEALKKIKAQLQRYRQAVLKYAFKGKLTEEWRETYKDKLESASVLLEKIKEERKKRTKEEKGKYNVGAYRNTPLQKDLPQLPEGWVWARLRKVTEIILGQSPPSSTYNENGSGLPFYQGKLEFGNLHPTPRKWCTSPRKIAEKGDVLISVRAPVGPTNICPEKSCIGRGLTAIRSLGGIETLFVLYLIRTYEHKLAGKGIGTTFKAITGDMLKEFVIPLPPLPEQRKIVEEIEHRLSVADKVEKVVEQSLKQAERLRQSILKKAFEGNLVPQDSNDEPAEKLLEKIKAEKAKREAQKEWKKEPKSKAYTKQMRLI